MASMELINTKLDGGFRPLHIIIKVVLFNKVLFRPLQIIIIEMKLYTYYMSILANNKEFL